MRTMLKVTIDVEAGNKAIQTGELGKIIDSLIEKIKPEAAYFGPFQGERSAFFFFDLNDSSLLPPLLEPLFGKLKAKVELMPVMNHEDLQKGFHALMGS